MVNASVMQMKLGGVLSLPVATVVIGGVSVSTRICPCAGRFWHFKVCDDELKRKESVSAVRTTHFRGERSWEAIHRCYTRHVIMVSWCACFHD